MYGINSFPMELTGKTKEQLEWRGPNGEIVDSCSNCGADYYWEDDHYKTVDEGEWCVVREVCSDPPTKSSRQGLQVRLYFCKCGAVLACEVVDDTGCNIYTVSGKEM